MSISVSIVERYIKARLLSALKTGLRERGTFESLELLGEGIDSQLQWIISNQMASSLIMKRLSKD